MIDLSSIILIDHHAHSLLNDFSLLDEISFRQAFSETNSLSMLQQHVANSIHYMHMLKELGAYLDIEGEQQIVEMRSRLGKRDYLQMLFDDASIGALIVDAGFQTGNMLALDNFSQLSGRPVYQCVRIESAIEECLQAGGSFSDLQAMLFKLLAPNGPRVVALKTIAAYRGGLQIDLATADEARADFVNLQADLPDAVKRFRITARPVYHYLLAQAFEFAQNEKLPVQIHCGLGDADADLRESNPWCFRSILESKRFAKTNFVFLHCYPYVREAALLASLYANVYIDLSLAVSLISPQAGSLFADALSVAPSSKILVATDGHSVPETYWYASHSARRGLTSVLGFLIGSGFVDENEALTIAARLFHLNAQELYALDDR